MGRDTASIDVAFLRRALDGAGVGAWSWDIQADRVTWSEGVYRLFGLAPGTFGRTFAAFLSLVHPDDRGAVEAGIRDILERRQRDFLVEHRLARPDGSTAWLEGRGELELDAAGKPRTLRGIVLDVTARKREKTFLESIIARAGEGICVCHDVPDPPYVRFTVWNDRMREITGYTMAEINELGWYQTLYPDPAVRQRAIDRMNEMRLGRDLRGEEWEIARKDGRTAALRISTTVLRHENGQTFVLAMIEDVTERRRLQDQLFQAQKVESIGRLAGGVAHDFNNLLTTVLGFAEIARQKLPAGSPASPALGHISEAAERGAGLTRQLLMFARRQKAQPVLFDLVSLVRRLDPFLRRLLGEDIECSASFPADGVPVLADPGQLEQVLLNLAVNARDAMPAGGRLVLAVESADVGVGSVLGREGLSPGPWAIFSVSDTGTGMGPEVRARLFEPFFTTKPVGRGTGLGLATSYGIVAQAGGKILVDSEPGKGSRFRVCLPRARGEASARDTSRREGMYRGTETLLFVEDDPAIRTLVQQLFDAQGYRVISAPNGEAALRALEAHGGEIDLLVSDVVMPAMGGRELWEALRRKRPKLKVLFTSGYTEDLVVQDPDPEGRRSFLPKPYTPPDLLRRVREILGGTRRPT